MVETKRLFYGTDASVKGCDILIGKRVIGNPGHSGNLTDHETTARVAAYGASDFSSKRPIVEVYDIPIEALIDEGVIGKGGQGKGAHGFSTNIEVRPEELPDEYLQLIGMTRAEAISNVREGKMSFFSVPRKYLRQVSHLGL